MSLTKSCIYYTDNQLDPKIAAHVRIQLRKATTLPIVSSSLEPLNYGDNYPLKMERGYLAMFTQILTCLENTDSDIVFFCEHDVLYPPEHFDFTPPEKGKFYYDLNWWKVRKDGLAVHWDAVQVSGMVCYRELAIKHYKDRIATFNPDNFDRKFEPTVNTEYEIWRAKVPHIDIRHDKNLTYNKWKLDHFRKKDTAVNFVESTIDKIPGWNGISQMLQ